MYEDAKYYFITSINLPYLRREQIREFLRQAGYTDIPLDDTHSMTARGLADGCAVFNKTIETDIEALAEQIGDLAFGTLSRAEQMRILQRRMSGQRDE